MGEGSVVTLEGSCPGHGDWQTVVWSGEPSFRSWCGDAPLPEARQVCTALLEVTRRCDLGCPVCFAESPAGSRVADPPVGELAGRLRRLFASDGEVNIQLSGGEPTMRDDLPEIIAAACDAGLTFVQLNTNGLRLANEDGYAESLRAAGLASVFLQFDGVSDPTYRVLRGRPLLAQKIRAVERCAKADLAVVLVPTVVPGVNDGELGDLVRFAASWPGVVRGLHLQPISYFGRYPGGPEVAGGSAAAGAARRPDQAVVGAARIPAFARRLTLPELLGALEEQTGGSVRTGDFSGSCCEHACCSFRARYWVREEGVLEPLRVKTSCCGPDPTPAVSPGEAPRRAVVATSRQWSLRAPDTAGNGAEAPGGPDTRSDTDDHDEFARFLDDADRILAISGMLFQDAWSVDMERIGRCCVQVVTEPGEHAADGLVPFCLWNLTSAYGERLYSR